MKTRVISTNKPPSVASPATAVVESFGATGAQVIDAGLAALNESRASVYGYGIRGLSAAQWSSDAEMSGQYVVYANRD